MEQLLDKLNKAPNSAKFGGLAALVAALTAGVYFLLIQDIETRIAALAAEQQTADIQLAEKQHIADNLKEVRREFDQLNQKLQAALTELPEKKDIDELLAQLNDVGKKAGLEITKVQPGGEIPEQLFAKIPINIAVSGNYHEIAMFMQEISNMQRIVNVNNIRLVQPTGKGDKVILASEFLATTFRFQEQSQQPPPKQ